MLIYLYDGSFTGLLTAIYEAYYRGERPEQILSQEESKQGNLFARYVEVPTDPAKADRVSLAVEQKISPKALRQIYYTYLSEIPEAGTWIYRYLDLGWQVGKKLNLHLHDERVRRILEISRKVGQEKHRMLGFVRFRQIQDRLYYAPIEPDYNILVLIAPHFSRRFADQNWIIHDLKRRWAAVFNQKQWFLTEADFPPLKTTAQEAQYQRLWQEYFDSIAIQARTNLELQRRFLPRRYWKHLIEKI